MIYRNCLCIHIWIGWPYVSITRYCPFFERNIPLSRQTSNGTPFFKIWSCFNPLFPYYCSFYIQQWSALLIRSSLQPVGSFLIFYNSVVLLFSSKRQRRRTRSLHLYNLNLLKNLEKNFGMKGNIEVFPTQNRKMTCPFHISLNKDHLTSLARA